MSEKITLPGLVARLSERTGDTKRETEDFIKELFAVIASALESGESVRVRDLGVFKTIGVEPRKSVNVNTGEPTTIQGHRKVVFIPAKELVALVNEPFEMFRTIELSDDAAEMLAAEDAGENSDIQAEPEEEPEAQEPVAEEELEPEVTEPDAPEDEEEMTEALYVVPDEPEETEAHLNHRHHAGPREQKHDHNEAETEPDGSKEETACEREEAYANDFDEDEVSIGQYGRRRYWGGFTVGFFVAMAIVFLVYAVWEWTSFRRLFAVEETVTVAVTEPDTVASSNETHAVTVPIETDSSAESQDINNGKEAEAQAQVKEETTKEVAPTQPSDKKVYDTITKTRYLTTMAKDHYGNYHLWPYIYKENASFLGHPDRIRPGTKVVIPNLSKYGVNPNNPKDIEKAKKLGGEIYSRYR